MTTQGAMSATGLVRPPPKVPVDPAVPGGLPPAGAGNTGPLPAPPTDPNLPGGLPYGNGVTPGPSFTAASFKPVNTVSPTGLTAPTMDPQVTPPSSYPTPPGENNLSGTLIAPNTGSGQIAPGAPILGSPTGGAPILGSPAGGAPVLPGNDPRLGSYQSLLDKSAGDLATTDRRSMLNSLLGDFDKQQGEADNNAYRQSGAYSASLGRIGSGKAAQDINQITRQSMGDRNRYRNQLAQDTINAEIGDRFSKTGVFRGLAGDAYDQGASTRNEMRGERGYTDYRGDQYLSDRRGERAYGDSRGDQYRNDARGERGWNYNVGRDNLAAGYNNRQELRGERTYQNNQDQTAIDRQVEQAKLSDYFTGTAFDRASQRYNAGRTGNPASTYSAAAGDYAQQSAQAQQAFMEFMQSIGIGQGGQ